MLDKRTFQQALDKTLRSVVSDWEADADSVEIDELTVWTLFVQLKMELANTLHNEEPTKSNPVIRDMTIAEFVRNMYEAYGVTL